MGKRSNFPRHPRDDYSTPAEAFEPLIPFLDHKVIIEPCPGAGRIVKHMQAAGYSVLKVEQDARTFQYGALASGAPYIFVTNPPWTREVLHPIIVNLSNQKPAWLLMDADWMHLKCARPYLNRLRRIVSIGRVQWFAGSASTGLDNSAWYQFSRPSRSITRFYGRA